MSYIAKIVVPAVPESFLGTWHHYSSLYDALTKHFDMPAHGDAVKTVVCHDVFGNQYDTPTSQLQWRPAAYSIVIKDNKVLLLKQFGNEYDLPGGGIDLGEDPKDAVVREAKEETGINVDRPILIGIESSFFRSSHTTNESFHSLLLYFRCEYVSGEPSTEYLEDYEKQYVQLAEWVPLSSLDGIEVSSTVDFRPYIRQCASGSWTIRQLWPSIAIDEG